MLAGVRSAVRRAINRPDEPGRDVRVLRVHLGARVEAGRSPLGVGDEGIREPR